MSCTTVITVGRETALCSAINTRMAMLAGKPIAKILRYNFALPSISSFNCEIASKLSALSRMKQPNTVSPKASQVACRTSSPISEKRLAPKS